MTKTLKDATDDLLLDLARDKLAKIEQEATYDVLLQTAREYAYALELLRERNQQLEAQIKKLQGEKSQLHKALEETLGYPS
jgi:hypothetical protein